MTDISKDIDPMDLDAVKAVSDSVYPSNWRNAGGTVLDENGMVVAYVEGNPDVATFIAFFDPPTVKNLVARARENAAQAEAQVPEGDLGEESDES